MFMKFKAAKYTISGQHVCSPTQPRESKGVVRSKPYVLLGSHSGLPRKQQLIVAPDNGSLSMGGEEVANGKFILHNTQHTIPQNPPSSREDGSEAVCTVR
jgi:hypothetical protein